MGWQIDGEVLTHRAAHTPSAANPDATAFALNLLHTHNVAVAPGETFGPGGAGLVRVALCASEEAIAQGLGKLIEVVQSGS